MSEKEKPDYASWEALDAKNPVALRVPRELVEAVFKYRVGALKLMLYIGAQAPQIRDGRMTVALSGKQLKSILGVDGVQQLAPLKGRKKVRILTEHQQIEKVCDELASRIVSMKVAKDDGSTTEYRGPACAWWSRNLERQEYRFAIDGVMLPLWQRVHEIVLSNWGYLADFASEYGIRIFLLLMAWRGRDGKTGKLFSSWARPFTVEWLRNHLGIEEKQYRLAADFRRKVVERAIADINEHSPIIALAKPMTSGPRRAITGYEFVAKIKVPVAKAPAEDRWPATVAAFTAFAKKHPEDELVTKIRARSGDVLKDVLARNGDKSGWLELDTLERMAEEKVLEEFKSEIEALRL